MKIEDLQKSSDLLTKLVKLEKDKSIFEKTKEFCKIRISGENGNEQEEILSINYIDNYQLIMIIREIVQEYYEEQISTLESTISKL